MLVRIVKMEFHPEHIETFLTNLHAKKEYIRNSSGCRLLELYRGLQDATIFFTYSYWGAEEDLENYRNSELFKNVWAETKVLFNAKPEAWSMDKVVSFQ